MASHQFPNYCCMCLEPEPTNTWRIDAVEWKHQEDKRVHVTETWIDVPMCQACKKALIWRRIKMVLGAIPFGAAAMAGWVWFWLKPDNLIACLGIGAVIFLLTSIFAYVIFASMLQAETKDEVAKISLDGSRITFANKDYQKMFANQD